MKNFSLLWGQRLIERGFGFFFFPVSLIWQGVILYKNFLYQKGWLQKRGVTPFVVSIGNIVAGGTGKTPFTLLLAKTLVSRKVAILLRGYGGDEERILSKAAKVYAGRDRLKLAEQAAFDGYELLLLDDGFQYQKLKRDLDIVLLKGNEQQDHFLPWGFLRDHPRRLKEAAALFTKGRDFSLEVTGSHPLKKGEKVGIFSGIANPASFRKTVDSLGVRVIAEWVLADHEKPREKKLKKFIDKCRAKGCKYLLTTEKDFVKISLEKPLLPILCVEVELKMRGEGGEKWKKLIATIEEKMDNRTA